jgi:hypothetical protein
MTKTNRNLKRKVKRVNEIFDEYSRRGYSNAWIYRNFIANTFYISERTFNRYINENTVEETINN